MATQTFQVLYTSLFEMNRGLWDFLYMIKLSTVITREVFFCPDKIDFFYDNLVAW
jgi:hypothetical protein